MTLLIANRYARVGVRTPSFRLILGRSTSVGIPLTDDRIIPLRCVRNAKPGTITLSVTGLPALTTASFLDGTTFTNQTDQRRVRIAVAAGATPVVDHSFNIVATHEDGTVVTLPCTLSIIGAFSASTFDTLLDWETGAIDAAADTLGANGFTGDAGQTRITTAQVIKGSQSVSLTIRTTDSDDGGFGTWGGTYTLPSACVKNDESWLQCYVYYPANPTYIISTDDFWLKYLRFRTVVSGGGNNGALDVQFASDPVTFGDPPFRVLREGTTDLRPGDAQSVSFGQGFLLPRGEWVRHDIHIVWDNITVQDGGTARFRMWQNTQLLVDTSTVPTLVNATDSHDMTRIHTFWNPPIPQTQTSYLDDFRVAKNGRPAWTFDLEGL